MILLANYSWNDLAATMVNDNAVRFLIRFLQAWHLQRESQGITYQLRRTIWIACRCRSIDTLSQRQRSFHSMSRERQIHFSSIQLQRRTVNSHLQNLSRRWKWNGFCFSIFVVGGGAVVVVDTNVSDVIILSLMERSWELFSASTHVRKISKAHFSALFCRRIITFINATATTNWQNSLIHILPASEWVSVCVCCLCTGVLITFHLFVKPKATCRQKSHECAMNIIMLGKTYAHTHHTHCHRVLRHVRECASMAIVFEAIDDANGSRICPFGYISKHYNTPDSVVGMGADI